MDQNIISHILTGEATPEEKEIFYKRLSESKEEEEIFYEVKSLWLHSSINHHNIDVDTEFELLWNKISHPEKPKTYPKIGIILRYAAIALVILGIGGISGYLISQNSHQETDTGVQKFTALKGSVGIVELADGTKIWLNSGSQISYHEVGKKRLAELSGEAYFEIKHREDAPFSVKANQIEVFDLGTTFNIKAYPGDKLIETSLVEGKADILSNGGSSVLALKPGDCAVYHLEEKNIEIVPVTQNVMSAWRDGKFVIRDQRLEDIFTELSRWYDVKFKFENKEVKDYRYTGTIRKSTTAQQVLKMLKLTANFQYRIIEKQSGSDVIIIY
jgi:ferric-dicitrate binding protein FerR (iron transport regulator)